ncbi:hypothetical protein C0075_22030 [Rhizobium sp. KAs_5_22]|nr:hypothetical protein C0075_22030 [Rhizobium sp. KAs_5_22]
MIVSTLVAAFGVDWKTKVSAPVPPVSVSLPTLPKSLSTPAPPLMVSLPPAPLRMLLPLLPVSRLLSALPTPLMLPTPSKVRFSILSPSVQLTAACTVSVPWPTASATTSATESTM